MRSARRRFAAVLRTAAHLALVLLSAGPASAVTYGDIEVTVESEPKGRSDHGYAELWVRVANRSKTAPHAVTVSFPRGAYFSSQDHVRSVSRSVAVEPGQVAVVPLTYPERLVHQGNGVGVAVDGRGQDDAVPVSISARGYGSHVYTSPGSPAAPDPILVLYSLSVDTRFPDWVRAARGVARPPSGPTIGPGTTVSMTVGTGSDSGCVRADRPAADWSPNWVGYSRYDGVVVTADDLRAMPAEVRNAIGLYVECGGTLLVLGPNPQLPGAWKLPVDAGKIPLAFGSAGFGVFFVSYQTDLSGWKPGALAYVDATWRATQAPWKSVKSVADANRRFPVVEDVGVPVTGLLALMLVFVLAIGPVNLFVLARMKRKLWLFWTVPAASAVTCLVVFAYTALAEGWTGKARVEGFTILDETTRRAASLGWAGVYSPLSPRDGLHFAPETEVTFQNGEAPFGIYGYRRNRSGAAALTMDWTRDQHLTSGWVTPRVPAHFAVRKGEARRERVTFAPGPDGKPEAVNGLGADLTDLWYADERGYMFHAKDVPAGGRAVLWPIPKPTPEPGGAVPKPRDLYAGEWADLAGRAKLVGPTLLTPRTYLALMDSAPFFDEGLPGKADRVARQAVLGLLPPAGKEGAK